MGICHFCPQQISSADSAGTSGLRQVGLSTDSSGTSGLRQVFLRTFPSSLLLKILLDSSADLFQGDLGQFCLVLCNQKPVFGVKVGTLDLAHFNTRQIA